MYHYSVRAWNHHHNTMSKLNHLNSTALLTDQVGKVAAIGLSFWVLKVVLTTIGDLSGDMLAITLGLGHVLALFVSLTIVSLLLVRQFKSERFHHALYWSLIFISSTVGAEISDTLDRTLHWGASVGSIVLFICLSVLFILWFKRYGRVGIYPIYELQDEFFYWGAVVFADALGSAIGDLAGNHFGFLGGVAMNIGVLSILATLYYKTRINKGFLFWMGFVFSRVSF